MHLLQPTALVHEVFLEEGSWAVLGGDEITGMIFIHQCDESEFKAKKANPT